ncbi:UNVERIFIED_CONTAM: ethanolamine utilization protein EutH [Halobacillus marinus]
MWFNDGVLILLCLFMVAGAFDYYFLNNRLKIGARFYEAFTMMGSLALSMIGIISLAPVLSEWLAPVISPAFQWFGADPSIFASMVLAIDMGAYPLSEALAVDDRAALFSWTLLGTMMGPTLVFTIPVALTIIKKEDSPYFAKGVLAGIATIPLGCLVGGASAGFEWGWMFKQLLPAILLAVLVSAGLFLFRRLTIRVFAYLGKGMEAILLIGLLLIAIETLTGLVLIPGMAPFSEGIIIVGKITITLAGAYPFVTILNHYCRKYFSAWSRVLGVNETALTGLLASLAHHLPMFAMMKEMNPRGKVINSAFAVSGAFVIGSHLGFVAGVEPEMILPVIIGKLTAGMLAVLLALFITRKDAVEEKTTPSAVHLPSNKNYVL